MGLGLGLSYGAVRSAKPCFSWASCYVLNLHKYYYSHLTASFPGQTA